MTVELDIFIKELLKFLRGKLSQANMSTKLGYCFNQYSRWESGKTGLLWIDLVSILHMRNLHAKTLLKKHFGFTGPIETFGNFILDTFCAELTPIQITEATQIIATRLRHIRSKPESVSVIDILTLLQTFDPLFPEFCIALSSGEALPPLKEYEFQVLAVSEVLSKCPRSVALIVSISENFVNVTELDFEPTVVALSRQTGFADSEIRTLIELLEAHGLASRTSNFISFLIIPSFVSFKRNRPLGIRIRNYWMEKLTELKIKHDSEGNYTFLIGVADERKKSRIEEVTKKFYEKISAVLNEENTSEGEVYFYFFLRGEVLEREGLE